MTPLPASSDLERIVSEDETARAGVDEARVLSEARLAEIRAELATARRTALGRLEGELDAAIGGIAAAADREVERRRAAREARARERELHASAQIDDAADQWADIIRRGRAPAVATDPGAPGDRR